MSILLKMYSRNNVKFEKMIHVFPIVGSLIVLGHSIVTMVERRYSLFSLSLFLYSDMMLVQYCRYAFERLPRREKSVRKFLLKLALFLLFSGNLFAIVCQSAPFYGPLTAALFYAMAIGGSIFLFYAYMIYDGDGGVDGGNYSDTEEKRHSAFPTMAESFSETV